jgi:hypothetical protein
MRAWRRLRRHAAGWCLLGCVLFAVAAVFIPGVGPGAAGAAAWMAGIALWPDSGTGVRRQALVLAAVGVAGLAWGGSSGVELPWQTMLSTNALLVAMLAAVSFFRLVAVPRGEVGATRSHGRRSVIGSLLGLHLFGAVVNLSSLAIMANRMAPEGRLDGRQVKLLTRGYAAASFWSPFFAAMATALTYAPGARIGALTSVGVPLAAIGLTLTTLELNRDSPETFRGYPMSLRSLWLPALLAGAILLVHELAPSISILGIIALLGPTMTLAVLWLRHPQPLLAFRGHVTGGLPLMRNELILFLAAGLMAAGLAAVMETLGGWVPFDHFGGPQAAAVVVITVLCSLLGIHPVVSIAAFGTLLAPLAPDQDLLAMAFLAGWSIGVVMSPLSGQNLMLQGAFGVRPAAMLRWNGLYGLIMLVVACLALIFYAAAMRG